MHAYIDSNIYSNPNPDQNENAPPPLAIRNIYRNNQKFNTKSIINVEFHAFPLLLPLQLYLPIKIPLPRFGFALSPDDCRPLSAIIYCVEKFHYQCFFFLLFFCTIYIRHKVWDLQLCCGFQFVYICMYIYWYVYTL